MSQQDYQVADDNQFQPVELPAAEALEEAEILEEASVLDEARVLNEATPAESRPVSVAEAAPQTQAAQGATPPAWFQKKKNTTPPPPKRKRIKRRVRKQPAVVIVADEEPAEPLTWQEELAQWFQGVRLTSLIIAGTLHAVLFLIFAFIILSGPTEREVDLLSYDATKKPLQEFIEIGQIEMDPNEGGDFAKELAQSEAVEMESDLTLPSMDVDLSAGIFDPNGTANGDGGIGEGITFVPGKNAVKKGSFTAWTKPEDPSPGQDYKIFIQIKVPKKLKRYPLKDLVGSFVIGTDGYNQAIPGRFLLQREVAVEEGTATLQFYVPGAEKLVKDTIKVQSQVLKEKQTITIEF